jgi:hypothetical protein
MIAEAENKLLCFLHYSYAHGSRSLFTETELGRQLPKTPIRILYDAAEALVEKGLLDKRSSYEEEEGQYGITHAGITQVDDWKDDFYALATDSVLFEIVSDVDDMFVVTPEAEKGDEIPAADRTVTVNHNSQPYREAIKSIEDVLREFREDHHLDNELGREKGALLKTLEAGLELLDDTTVNVRIATALVVEPLKRIAQRYEQAIAGGLAQVAIDFVLKLLGLK